MNLYLVSTVVALTQAVATEEVCAAFDGVGSREALSALGRRSAGADLPGAVCVGASAAGEWVEFDPHWTPPGQPCCALRPFEILCDARL